MPPTVFQKCLKNSGAQRRQSLGACAENKKTSCVQTFTSQLQRSGHQVRSKSDVHSGTGFKIKDRAVGIVLVRKFSNFQDEI